MAAYKAGEDAAMNIVPVLETYSVALEITGVSDVASDGRLLVPDMIEVTYQWTPPAHRRAGEKYLRVQVKVQGRRRLKSGQVGRSRGAVLLDEQLGWPEWVAAVVVARVPEGWDR